MDKKILEKWDNTCIKVLSLEHGKQVIDFWKSVGVNTNGFMGNSLSYCYYGLFDGNFNNWDSSNSAKVLTLEEAIAIRDEEIWKPQFGEMVMAYDEEADIIKDPHIFLFEKNGLYHCVSSGKKDIEEFNSSDYLDEYRVFKYKKISKIEEPKQIEISLEEAKEIIAKEKGISVEQVNLNFKINLVMKNY